LPFAGKFVNDAKVTGYNVVIRIFLQRGNQTPYIEEEQTAQWPKEKVQKTNNDLQNIHIKLKIKYHEPH
jgi:hypothetical protein